MDTRFRDIIITTDASIKEALSRISSLQGLPLTLFVTDSKGELVGTLTDGDIRRGLLRGASLLQSVSEVMHRQYLYLEHGRESAPIFKQAHQKGIAVLPMIDERRQIVDIIDLRHQSALLPMDAVLMAGGRGIRLRPLTDTTPKPLLPIAGRPIIDYNVEALRRCGINNIFVTVNYLRTLIEEHFSAEDRPDRVVCVPEPAPLGTFGSVGLVRGLKHDHVLVMNSDLLTNISFEKMYEHHLQSGAALTMAVTTYTVSVPYAIVRTQGDRVKDFSEKPTYNFFANAGIYIVNRELLSSVNGTERIDATDFIDSLLASGQKVSYFPIDGTWIDIGSPDDYAMACSSIKL